MLTADFIISQALKSNANVAKARSSECKIQLGTGRERIDGIRSMKMFYNFVDLI